jgi:hypothetical protein
MSCGCGKLPKGTFSPLTDTWSKNSDLLMSSWDPYPELKDCNNLFRENYGCSTGCDPNNYKMQMNKLNSTYVPLQQSVMFTEKYTHNPLNKPINYNELNTTWIQQKPFTL